MRDIRKALASIRQKVEEAKPIEGVPVIFPGDVEPAAGRFIKVLVVDASLNAEETKDGAENNP